MQALPPATPGIYPGSGQAGLLRANEQQYLFQNQANANGQASIAVQLERIKAASYPFGASFEFRFSGAPGTFAASVQTADLDQDSSFVTINTLSSGLNTSNVGRIELPSFWAKFVRVYVELANAVNVTALVTR